MAAIIARLLLLLILIAVVLVFPWLLMLFLGNLGLNVSFWGALPGGILLALIGGSGSTPKKS